MTGRHPWELLYSMDIGLMNRHRGFPYPWTLVGTKCARTPYGSSSGSLSLNLIYVQAIPVTPFCRHVQHPFEFAESHR